MKSKHWHTARRLERFSAALLALAVALIALGYPLLSWRDEQPEFVIVVAGIVVLVLEGIIDRRASRAMERAMDTSMCPSCGYDLRGADHAVCPECGVPVAGEKVTS